jgi:hypothetical protein
VQSPTRGRTRTTAAPYVDIELCFDADQGQVTLARSVAAEIAHREGAERAYVEKVRQVVGRLTCALLVLAEHGAKVHCLFRVLESQVRVSVSVRGSQRPSPEAKSEHARLLDHLIVSASTYTRRDDSGGFSVVSDAFIPLDD